MATRIPVIGAVPWQKYEGPVEPVEVRIERACKWKAKPKHGDGRKQLGCANCGEAKYHPGHVGAPPSMNDHSIDRVAFAQVKGQWEHAMCLALLASGLPRGLEAATVEVLIGFDQYRDRDEGNLRWMIEKALGDALVHGHLKAMKANAETAPLLGLEKDDKYRQVVIPGGWLPSDSFWPRRRYSMGNLEGRHAPGESWTVFRVFPSTREPEPEPHARELAQPSLL